MLAGLGSSLAKTTADAYDNDPSRWTGRDVYTILNKSPWTQTVKASLASGEMGGLGDSGPGAGSNGTAVPPPMPANSGGMGRRGGRSAGGTYSSGGGSRTSSPAKSGPTEIRIQWQSAMIVRLALAKKGGDSVDAASIKPLNEYVIAVIGLPITAIGGRSASADSDSTVNSEQEQRIEQHVKSSASIIRPSHDPLTPTKVELDQGSDGRMLIHFPKNDPITANDKSVEFRLAIGRTEIKKKFALKEMEFQRKLEL